MNGRGRGYRMRQFRPGAQKPHAEGESQKRMTSGEKTLRHLREETITHATESHEPTLAELQHELGRIKISLGLPKTPPARKVQLEAAQKALTTKIEELKKSEVGKKGKDPKEAVKSLEQRIKELERLIAITHDPARRRTLELERVALTMQIVGFQHTEGRRRGKQKP